MRAAPLNTHTATDPRSLSQAGPTMSLRFQPPNHSPGTRSAYLPTWAAPASQPWAQRTGLRDASFSSDMGGAEGRKEVVEKHCF